MRAVSAGFKLVGVMAMIFLVFAVQTPVLWFTRGPKSYFFTYLYHIAICRILGLKIDVVGTPAYGGQTLYVGNHLSYIDITLIGRLIRRASFIAKKETRAMPIYGYLSTMQQTAYVSRDRKNITKERGTLDSMIAEGKSLILFPEGTSTEGVNVLPFKSSLFGIVLQDGVKDKMAVQAFTISLMEVDGKPVRGMADRELYAWTVAMSDNLTEHLWRFLKTSGARLRVEFHPPVMARDFVDRKALALAMQELTSCALVLPEAGKNPKRLDSAAKAA